MVNPRTFEIAWISPRSTVEKTSFQFPLQTTIPDRIPPPQTREPHRKMIWSKSACTQTETKTGPKLSPLASQANRKAKKSVRNVVPNSFGSVAAWVPAYLSNKRMASLRRGRHSRSVVTQTITNPKSENGRCVRTDPSQCSHQSIVDFNDLGRWSNEVNEEASQTNCGYPFS